MNLKRLIKLIVVFLFLFFYCPSASAKAKNFVTIVNPVRGDEFFDPKPWDFLEGFKIQKQLIDKYNLSATWLLRFDVLSSLSLENFKDTTDNYELGIFLEITPSLAKLAEVSYPAGGIFWHDANKIFLSGYQPQDRIKLVDTVFEKFKEKFGYFPQSVGAWHVDAYSASYMRRKYGVTGVLICADQFGTDNYQIWGGWWGVPYYPSRFNILTPAQTLKNKLDIVVFWWAARDPVLGYGGSGFESGYSVQVNDYTFGHNLGADYFSKLLDYYLKSDVNKFGQITVGLENDMDFSKLGRGFEEQLLEISMRENKGEIIAVKMSEFSDWYRKNFPKLSPDHQIDGWIMNKDFRASFIEKEGGLILRDLRIYNENWPEANFLTANPWPSLSLSNPYKLDAVRFGDSIAKADFEISYGNIIDRFGVQKIPFRISTTLLLSCYFVILLVTILLIKNITFLFLTLIGSIAISIPMVKSGLVYKYGMGFWGPNGHDGIWHLALINQLKNFSLQNPVFSGIGLTNYHFGFDLLAAFLSKLTGINPVNLYFQILPPVMAILIGCLTFKFVEKWLGSKTEAWWSTFFVYFGGSWGWLVSLVKTGRLGGESIFWANQAISTLINPPYGLSLIVLLLGLIQFLDYLRKPNFKNLIICSILFGILIQVKVYAGVIILTSLFLTSLFTLILRSIEVNIQSLFRLSVLSLVIAAGVFLPFNFKSASFLVFSPLWFPRTMLAYADRLGWFRLENARIAYLNTGKWFKWLLAEGLALLIFILGNLGTRMLGFFYGGFIWKKRKTETVELFLLFSLAISLVLPLLFIQRGNPWNTIQFFYYFQFFMAIFAGVFIGKLWDFITQSKKYHIFIYVTSVLVVLLTLPTTYATLKNDYLPFRAPAKISVEELEALGFLKEQPQGIVLSAAFNQDWRFKFSEPKPLYAYETTAYVSALSGQPSFLEDEMNLEITGFDWKSRRNDSQRFFLTADQKWGKDFLQENKIKYIYLAKGQKMNLGLKDIGGEKIFENGEVVIYKIN